MVTTKSLETMETGSTISSTYSVSTCGCNDAPSSSSSFDIEASTTKSVDKDYDSTDSNSSKDFGTARTPWYGTSLLILGDVLGTGILSLPFAAATLGWVSSMVFIFLCAFLAHYTSTLLTAVKTACPHVTSYGDAAKELVGNKFGTFTKVSMIVNWAALAIYFLVATADAIGNINHSGWLACGLNRTIIAAVLLLAATQVRDFHSLTKLAGPSFVAILTVVIIILVTLLVHEDGEPFGDDTTVGPIQGTSALDYILAASSIVFAYQGQSIFLEMMSEMKDSREFPKSSGLAYSIMAMAYAATVMIAYGTEGTAVPGFLPDILDSYSHVSETVSGVLTCFHIIVAYVLNIQPIHIWLHTTFRPKTLYKSSFEGARDWFIITLSTIVIAWLVANLIPFFAAIQSVLGSLFGAPTMFGWPPLFYFIVKQRETSTKSIRETLSLMGPTRAIICSIMFFILTPLFVIFGTYSGMANLIQQAEVGGSVFGCN
jgi:amino acid permease